MKSRKISAIIPVLLATAVVATLSACGSTSSENTREAITDAVEKIEEAVEDVVTENIEDPHVTAVKNGTNSNYAGVTYGQAFDNFFGNPEWRYFKGTSEGPDDDGDGEPDYLEENVDVVEFTGRCTYQDVEVQALIQFEVGEDTFEATFLSLNEVPENRLILAALIDKAFESYGTSYPGSASSASGETGEYGTTGGTEDEQAGDAGETEAGDAGGEQTGETGGTEAEETGEGAGDYNYEALSFAGRYEGQTGYTVEFSAYTDVVDDEIGVADIYYDGESVGRWSVYRCYDPGVWSDYGYDQIYVMYGDGYREFLCFYYEEGVAVLDYNSEDRNMDYMSMVEHYGS